jgi:hypothetical protein
MRILYPDMGIHPGNCTPEIEYYFMLKAGNATVARFPRRCVLNDLLFAFGMGSEEFYHFRL